MGTNTAQSTSAIATMGPDTSFIAWWAASRGLKPSWILRSTFSTTTMASSTTMPIASTRPNKVSVLIEQPKRYRKANVPTTETGTATSGMMEARQVCKNRITTSTTNTTASINVCSTARIDSRTNTVGSQFGL